MEVYDPRHRTGEDLLPVLEAVLAGEGSAAVDPHTGSIVLVGSGPVVARALELLRRQDRALRTVVIQHETRRAGDLEASGVRIDWSVGGGRTRVGNVVERDGDTRVHVRPHDRSAAGEGADTGLLRVLEGEWGRIARGAEVLLPTGSWRHPDAVRVAAETGLEVRPRVLGGGRVRLDLRPFQGSLRPGGVVERASAETTLVVEPGRTVVVGGMTRTTERSGRSRTGGFARSTGRREEVLLLTVTLEGPAPGPAVEGAR